MSANHFAQFLSPLVLNPLNALFGGNTVTKLLIASLMLFAFGIFLFIFPDAGTRTRQQAK